MRVRRVFATLARFLLYIYDASERRPIPGRQPPPIHMEEDVL